MPLAWDCRNTQASKTKGLKKHVGEYAFVLGIAMMGMEKIPYGEMYLHTLTITKKNSTRLAKYLTEKQFFHQKNKQPATLEDNKKLVTLFVGSQFTRTMRG